MHYVSSARLYYRCLKDSDWSFFLALNQNRHVMHFISDPRTDEEIRIQSFDERLQPWHKGSGHWLCLVMSQKNTDFPVGVTGFIDRGEGIAEVGFILSAEFHGQGLGSESLKDLARFAFDTHGYRKLTATVTSGNEASRRTLLKVGFQQEGTLRKNYFLHGCWQDDWVFGLLKDEFSY
ncbi:MULTISPECIES: GNAT family N-acetyltransferase [Serratia]|uniref:GNAT family N-acetyltransferase n=1 Tax=Serratia TaxID=613 RepID=UPI0018D5DB5E|nr:MULTISPECIES: GNAT family N-acetyltransferase [Serratia]MBH2749666.1 GNAT family N-acetyltransferase [Serratia marcescens]MDY0768505.1 GNAT family protein [Serratia nevei]MED6027230.1 GNAT family protein [Serratia marcescens]